MHLLSLKEETALSLLTCIIYQIIPCLKHLGIFEVKSIADSLMLLQKFQRVFL